ncbi:rho GTPase-activating protein 23-like isoform X3 [Paramormyrops kingsleyae]|uniref:rho GTPase-activating protein 23-like isoform X3 n=1 Tax=Paramormyrops kingsleyae TaxID=1676925 RepID=UPI000CD5DC8F|nr:rho GTPase-activating protein 23-like isoform X3 [Paramormyrops kingsleyae]
MKLGEVWGHQQQAGSQEGRVTALSCCPGKSTAECAQVSLGGSEVRLRVQRVGGRMSCLVGSGATRSHAEDMAQAQGQRDGISTSNEKTQPELGNSVACQGPRTVVLRKNSEGFGFTLRHFIVYPPESTLYLKDEENGNGKGYFQSRLEPVDTIFVKNVREKGPAHQAGLCTGDRLVKVNRESVLGKTYSQVIALIQNSENILELTVMPKDEDVLQLAYSQDAYLKGHEPYKGEAQNLPDPPPVCYPRSKIQPTAMLMGQSPVDNWNCWPGSVKPSNLLDNHCHLDSRVARVDERAGRRQGEDPSVVAQIRGRSYSLAGKVGSPLHFHFTNHQAAIASASQTQLGLSKSELCQQALSDWYYSQTTERLGLTMPPRHRSFSQGRLVEVTSALNHQRVGWPHSSSQNTLLLQSSDPYWMKEWDISSKPTSNRACSSNPPGSAYICHSRSMEMLDQTLGLVSPCSEKSAWISQAQKAPFRTDGHQQSNYCTMSPVPSPGPPMPLHQQQPTSNSQQVGQSRRLPPQGQDEQSVGYQSYSPSFYHKAGRLLQAHSFRDPAYTGLHFNWEPTPKASPPKDVPIVASRACTSPSLRSMSKPPNGISQQTKNERPLVESECVSQTQKVVLRPKLAVGRHTSHAQRHPNFSLSVKSPEPHGFTLKPNRGASIAQCSEDLPQCPNDSLLPVTAEDDSLAFIPYIDEPTSPSADLCAQHVPASSVVSSAMSSTPAVSSNPVSPTFTFPLTRLYSQNYNDDPKSSQHSSSLLAITTERSKSFDEGLNAFRDEGRGFSRLPKRVKSFFADGSFDSLGNVVEAHCKRHSTSELGTLTFSNVRKEGWLHYKQILTEKGKKLASGMRPWKRVFSVLRSHLLYLYKDKREAVLHGATLGGGARSANCEDEQLISIHSCLVDIAYSETKRKHVLRLTTQDFCEYLLQAEDRDDMLSWIKVICENSRTDSEEFGSSRQALINKKLNDYRKQSPMGSKPDLSPKMPRMKPSFLLPKADNPGAPPLSPKTDGKEENNLPKAPWGINLMKKVKKAGPKVFGVRLEDCQPGAINKFVPLIVETCCGLVEEMGLEYIGIYRVPGNNAMVSSLQDQLNKGADINLAEEKWQDLNVISSLLKSFLRKLPEPLFTDDKYSDFIDANRMENASNRLKTMKKLVHDLPDHYYHTLKYLAGHLKTVADNAEKNKMEPRNLALVFGPTLVRTSEDNMTEMVTHMPDRYKIVETLIQHYAWFFTEELAVDDQTPVDKEDLQPIPNIDHLLSNIGRTGQEASADSTNSDSAKSKGSWGSRRDLTAKDFTLSLLSAVTRKRRKRPVTHVLGSSTDEDSEHEPIKASNRGGRVPKREQMKGGNEEREPLRGGAAAPRAVEEDDDHDDEDENDEDEEEEEEREEDVDAGKESMRRLYKEEDISTTVVLQEKSGAGVGMWREPEDAHSIVSGYSTLSTLRHSLASEGRGDDADDEHSELVSETDNESGFASQSLTQERPEKPTQQVPYSFLYSPHKPPQSGTYPPSLLAMGGQSEGSRHSTTPSSSSFSSSSTTHRPHSRTSFSSHKLIQCDTLARKKLKGEKPKSLDVELEQGTEDQGTSSKGAPSEQGRDPVTNEESPNASLPLQSTSLIEMASFTPCASGGQGSLAEQVQARLLGSIGDLRGVGLRKPVSPETRRKKSSWRRHTIVVHVGDSTIFPMDAAISVTSPNKDMAVADRVRPDSKPVGLHCTPEPPLHRESVFLGREPATPQPVSCSRFHQYL